jgi:IS5 family transposase
MRQKTGEFKQSRCDLRGAEAMRKAFDRQQRMDCQPISNVALNLGCRDEMIPILAALKHIYTLPELREEILQAIAADVNPDASRKRGRKGMDYWSILVLASVRLGCNFDYDRLQDLAEQHRALRQMMGIGDWDEETSFNWRTIRNNITLLRPETLERINHAIVAAGHILQPTAAETVRADSFVAETNIHYPTESSLIRDGLRKVLHLCVAIATLVGGRGWRQHQHLYKKAKSLARQIDRVAARKGNGYQQRLQRLYGELLHLAEAVLGRAEQLRENLKKKEKASGEVLALETQLQAFIERTRHVCGTASRRVLQRENVPNNEKLFSIFEMHTQLYKRGKAAQPVQFGRQVLVYEDGAGFITHAYLMPRDADDHDVVVKQTRDLQERLGGRIRRASFDRGFHSPENQRQLAEIIEHPCVPMPGANQAREQEAEATVEFHQARQRHPGIESAINALQAGNGLTRCRDRSERGFSRYVQLAVVGRNLHVLGKILLAREDSKCEAAESRRKRNAA